MQTDFRCACPDEVPLCTNRVDFNGQKCESCFFKCKDSIRLAAKHFDENKPGIQFILGMPGLDQVAVVGDYGAKKYGQWNYRAGMAWMKLAGSCARHLTRFILGEDKDAESGLHHLAHLVYDALMLLGYTIEHPLLDDRFKR